MQPIKDASHLYEVERRAEHAARPGFRITELQISSKQKVPWHCHTNVQDTFYVLEGELRLFLREPKEEVRLRPGETYSVAPRRPHVQRELVVAAEGDERGQRDAGPGLPVETGARPDLAPRVARDEVLEVGGEVGRVRDRPVDVLVSEHLAPRLHPLVAAHPRR